MPKNTDRQEFIVRNIPRDMWEVAKAKCADSRPPISLNYLVIALVEKWVGHVAGEMSKPKAPTPPKAKVGRKRTIPSVASAPRPSAPQGTNVPDLGDAF